MATTSFRNKSVRAELLLETTRVTRREAGKRRRKVLISNFVTSFRRFLNKLATLLPSKDGNHNFKQQHIIVN